MSYRQDQIGGRFGKSYGDTVAESGSYVQQGDVGTQNVTVNGGLHLHVHSPVRSVSAAGTVVQFLDVVTKLSTLGQHLRSNSVTMEEEICQLVPVSTSLRLLVRQLIDELTSSRANDDDSITAKVCVLALAQSVTRNYFFGADEVRLFVLYLLLLARRRKIYMASWLNLPPSYDQLCPLIMVWSGY